MSSRLKEQRRQELARQQRRRRIVYGIIAVVVLVAVGALIVQSLSRQSGEIAGVEELGPQDRGHAENIDIADEGLPPAGGTHNPRWLNCGVYREPVETELAVHSLEHGAVWLAYRPDLPAETVAELERYGDAWTLVAPYPGLENDVILTAWAARLRVDGVPDERIDNFIARYEQEGPEPGATCSGGVGTPVGG